jgi:hypothetical protein
VSKWEDQEQMVADGAERVSIREALRSAGQRHRGEECPGCGQPLAVTGRCANPPCDYYRVPASAVRILEAQGDANHRDSQAQAAYQQHHDRLQAEGRLQDRGARVTSGKEARAWLEEDRVHFSHTYYG